MSNNTALPAPLWRRLFAMGYDSLLLCGVIIIAAGIHLGIKIFLIGEESIQHAPTGSFGGLLLFIQSLGVTYLFFYWFWRHNGQTLGMQAWRIKVQQVDGKPITLKQAFIRLLIAPLSLACLGLGYFWCLFGPQKTWHDLASDTIIVLVPKQ